MPIGSKCLGEKTSCEEGQRLLEAGTVQCSVAQPGKAIR